MDYSQYEIYGFDRFSAFNMSTGYEERSYQTHWHSYGEILLVGAGETNVYRVNQNVYHLEEDDFVLVWPMEMHGIIDADRQKALVIQFSHAFINSLFDLQRIMHFYRRLHVISKQAHPELVEKLKALAYQMKEVFFSDGLDREMRCCMLLMQFMLTLDEHRRDGQGDVGKDQENQSPGIPVIGEQGGPHCHPGRERYDRCQGCCHRHHQDIPVLHVGELVGEDPFQLLIAEQVEKRPCGDHGRILRTAPGGERIRHGHFGDPYLRHRNACFVGQSFDGVVEPGLLFACDQMHLVGREGHLLREEERCERDHQ